MKNSAIPAISQFQDILQVLPNLPSPDLAAATAAMAAAVPENRATLGWLARWQGRPDPQLRHPRLSIFAANHGVGAIWHPPVTAVDVLAPILRHEGALIVAAEAADADLRVYDLNLNAATCDFTVAAALTTPEAVNAITYGMAAVDNGLNLLALASCGDGQELSNAVIIAALTGQMATVLLTQQGVPVIASIAAAAERAQGLDPGALLENFGGAEIAALLGAMIAARMAHTPVVIADWGGLAALCLLDKLDHRAAQHVALAGNLCALDILPTHQRLPAGNDNGLGLAAAHSIIALQALV